MSHATARQDPLFFFRFEGRINKKEYWMSLAVAAAIVAIFISFILVIKWFSPNVIYFYKGVPLEVGVGAFGLYVFCAATVKRLHDRDKDWYWLLLALIPVAGLIWLVVECGMRTGTIGPNRFGPDPLGNHAGPTPTPVPGAWFEASGPVPPVVRDRTAMAEDNSTVRDSYLPEGPALSLKAHDEAGMPIGESLVMESALKRAPMVIGRDQASGFVIPETSVSRRHAHLFHQGGRFFIEDLGSSNGLVKDRHRYNPGEPIEITNGTTVFLGRVKVTFARVIRA